MYRKTTLSIIVPIIVVAVLSAFGDGCRSGTAGAAGRRVSTLLLSRKRTPDAPGDRSGRPEVFRIDRVRGAGDPETLAEFEIGNWSPAYLLSPDRRTLLINIGTKIKRLDLETKELSDLAVRHFNGVRPLAFSPDSKRVLLWDHDCPGKSYRAVVYDLTSGTSEVLAEGRISDPVAPFLWLPDNTVLMEVLLPEEYGWLVVYDLNSRRFVDSGTGKRIWAPMVSRIATYAANETASVDNACTMYGDSTRLEIVDTRTRRAVDTIGDGRTQIANVVFSPDERKILYSVAPTLSDLRGTKPWDCDGEMTEQQRRAKYFVKVIGGAVFAADPEAVRDEWDAPQHAKLRPHDASVEFYGRTLGPLAGQAQWPEIIGEYYEDEHVGLVPWLERWLRRGKDALHSARRSLERALFPSARP